MTCVNLLSEFVNGKISAESFEESLDDFKTLDSPSGCTLLNLAIAWRSVETFDILARKGAAFGWTYSLFDAVYNYSESLRPEHPHSIDQLKQICNRLFTVGISAVDMYDPNSRHSLLHHAIYRKLFEFAEWLIIDHDACTDMINVGGQTPLQTLIVTNPSFEDNRIEAMRLFNTLTERCEVNWQDKHGYTALSMVMIWESSAQKTQVIERLRDMGARDDLKSNTEFI